VNCNELAEQIEPVFRFGAILGQRYIMLEEVLGPPVIRVLLLVTFFQTPDFAILCTMLSMQALSTTVTIKVDDMEQHVILQYYIIHSCSPTCLHAIFMSALI